MSDDPKEKEAPARTVEQKQEHEGAPGNNTVSFVPYMNPAIYSRHRWWWTLRHRAALLNTNNQVFPPLLNTNSGKTVRYLDFGFTSAREYWAEVVLPAYECFKANPSRGSAIIASLPAWHIQDWIWHEKHPGEDTRDNNKDYTEFQNKLFKYCPELPWIRDVADAGKHRGLGRSTLKVRKVKNTWPRNTSTLTIGLDDGTEHDFADVLSRVIEYWRTQHFP